MANNNSTILIVIVVAFLVIGYGGLDFFKGSSTPQGTQNSPYYEGEDPVINIAGVDAYLGGTTVSASAQASINGGAFASTTLGSSKTKVDNTIELFLTNGTSYHNMYVNVGKVAPSSFPVQLKFNKNSTVTETIATTTGLPISNGGGSQNQTDFGNGISYNMKDTMTAAALTTTQDMTCVFELTAGSNASTTPSGVLYGPYNGAALPVKANSANWYTGSGVDSKMYFFDIPALSNGATAEYNINVNAKSTGRFGAGTKLIKSCYTKEWFIDSKTGKATYDVADGEGVIKSLAKYSYTVYFQ